MQQQWSSLLFTDCVYINNNNNPTPKWQSVKIRQLESCQVSILDLVNVETSK